jgi:outer membrane receptor protein involved in Fe transport
VTVGQGPGTFPIVGFVAAGGTYRQRRNVDAIVAKGFELTGRTRHGPWSLSASYAYSDSKVKAPGLAFDGLAPAQSPRHNASATLVWSPKQGPYLSATLRHVGRQYEDDLQSNILAAATTLDTVAQLPLGKRLAVQGRIENLFDETVITRNAGGSIDLGTPRTFWIRFILQ